VVPDLEAELARRAAIIEEMQKIINELEERQTAILTQEHSKHPIT
jgi:hypothetical protein